MTDITLKMVEDARDELIEEFKKPSRPSAIVVSMENKEKLDKVFDSDYIRSRYIGIGEMKNE